MLSAGFGLMVGFSHAREADQAAAVARLLPPQRFVVVEITPLRSWEKGFDEGAKLRADSFLLDLREKGSLRIDEPITIAVSERTRPLGWSKHLQAEGFLSRKEGRWLLRVKSVELIDTSGTIRPVDPRFWNRRLSEAIDAVTTSENAEPLALARALVLGQSDRLPDHVRDSYIDGGTYHLLVFSGLQIGIAAAFLAWLLRDFRRPLLSDFGLLAMALLAPMFAGNEPSVARASLMIGVWAGARAIGRPTLRSNLLLVACGFRLATHPDELRDAGFVLTFAATAGLAIVGPALARLLALKKPLFRAACSGMCAELAVLPITIHYFGRYVLGGWIVTMLISPVIVILLALSAAACAAAVFQPDLLPVICRMITAADAVCRSANSLVDSDLRLAGVAIPAPLAMTISAYAVSLVLISFRSLHARASIALCLMLPTVWAITTTARRTLPPGDSVTAIDVGQGDAILVSDGESALLVDGGGRRGDPRFGQRVLIPQLLELGARRIDVVVMSHPDADHCAGLAAVVLRLEVGEVWLSGRHLREPCSQLLFEAANRRSVPVVVLEHHERRSAGSIETHAILPRLRYKKSPLNNGSLVLLAAFESGRVLLAGDIEAEAEFVLTDDGVPMAADVLKVPHHGSRTSTGDALLDAVNPRWAIVSTGAENTYGHPADQVLERFASRGIRLLRTDRDGTCRITFGPQGLQIDRHLTSSPRR